ncbi:mediator of RNA polymerase II transcription subunit 12-like, partial [Penaeus japonicus]|uniref:mediator of RNA polymerase II transcription subunit 12-like n=1 Tax=Penaeus japonicus TaxID=27405 RepID=UPI001C7142C0
MEEGDKKKCTVEAKEENGIEEKVDESKTREENEDKNEDTKNQEKNNGVKESDVIVTLDIREKLLDEGEKQKEEKNGKENKEETLPLKTPP